MRDLNDKSVGNSLTADEWNDMPSELQNIIENTEQALSGADLNQLGKGVAQYVANGDFYTDGGAADAYTLTPLDSKQNPEAYTDMMRVRFKAANTNTGASTVNVNSIGAANIFRNGAAVVAGDIPAGLTLTCVYDLGNTRFNWVDVDIPAKKVVQTVFVQDGAVASGALTIPIDDTIPQNTEGNEVMTLAITPTNALHLLKIEVSANLAASVADIPMLLALFQDSTADALAVVNQITSTSIVVPSPITLTFWMVAGTVSATTFKARAGTSSASTTTFNGITAARVGGGVLFSSIAITEYSV